MIAEHPRARRIHAATGAVVSWGGLVLQYVLLLRASELGPIGATIRFFSYFTILTNTLVACAFTAALLPLRPERPRFFTRPAVQSGIALAIALVGVVYSLLLRRIWDPQGWQLVADRVLHDVVPVLFVAYWILWVPKRALTPSMAWRWAFYPVVYFGYAVLQARLTGWYPYPFIDASELGYVVVLRNALAIMALFLVAGGLMVVAGRRFSRA